MSRVASRAAVEQHLGSLVHGYGNWTKSYMGPMG